MEGLIIIIIKVASFSVIEREFDLQSIQKKSELIQGKGEDRKCALKVLCS
jgi:hypothetical protein